MRHFVHCDALEPKNFIEKKEKNVIFAILCNVYIKLYLYIKKMRIVMEAVTLKTNNGEINKILIASIYLCKVKKMFETRWYIIKSVIDLKNVFYVIVVIIAEPCRREVFTQIFSSPYLS